MDAHSLFTNSCICGYTRRAAVNGTHGRTARLAATAGSRGPSILLTCLAVCCPLLCGCSHLTHRQHAEQAQKSWDEVRSQVKLQLAAQLFDTGHAREAARASEEALALDPASAGAYALLSRARLELGDVSGATSALRLAAAAGVDSAELSYLQGVVLEQRGNFADALTCYEKACADGPSNLDYWLAYAECLVAAGRENEALIVVLEQIDAVDRNGAMALLGARVADLTGDAITAERLYRRAAQESDAPATLLAYGQSLVRRQRFAEGRVVLEPLLVGDLAGKPEGTIRRAVAQCHLALAQPRLAMTTLGDYVRTHGEDCGAQLLYATAALQVDNFHAALQSAHTVLSRRPHDPEALLILATVHQRLGQTEAALKALDRLLIEKPSDELAARMRDRLARADFDPPTHMANAAPVVAAAVQPDGP